MTEGCEVKVQMIGSAQKCKKFQPEVNCLKARLKIFQNKENNCKLFSLWTFKAIVKCTKWPIKMCKISRSVEGDPPSLKSLAIQKPKPEKEKRR